jgi:Rhodopirellula transposase DDE domain
MAIPSEVRGQLGQKFELLLAHLNEHQRRLAVAAEARLLGHGGVRAVARAAGVSETTVRKGAVELAAGEALSPVGRVRRPGGDRKRAAQRDPQLVAALLALVEPDERGDPESPLRWTTRSLRHLADELGRQGHPVSAPTVGALLREHGFSLQANARTLEGKQHPDQDALAQAAEALRAQLGDAAFDAAWAAGQAMSLEQAVAEALEDAPDALCRATDAHD